MLVSKKIFSFCILLVCFFIATNSDAQTKKSVFGISNSANNSSIIDYDVPSNLKPGEEFVVTINMVNNGVNTWTMKEGYHLALFEELDNRYMSDVWDVKNVALPYDVNPSQKVSFLFKIKAPYTAGMYNNNWAMTKDNEFFGEYNSSLVNVGGEVVSTTVTTTPIITTTYRDDPQMYSSNYIDQTVPNDMVANNEYKISITMSNTGKQTWIKGQEQLVLTDAKMSPISLNSWNVGYVQLDKDVPPGTLVTFEFSVKPTETGWQNFQWIMMNGEGTTFGAPTQPVQIIVGNSSK